MRQHSERGITLAGDAALEWFAARAIIAETASDQPVRVVADSLQGRTLSLTRIWHSPLTLITAPGEENSSAVRLVLLLDGRMDITLGEDSFRLDKYEVILFSDSSKRIFSTDGPSARVEIVFSSASTLHPHVDAVLRMTRVVKRSVLSDVLAGVITLTFSSGIAPTDRGWSQLSRIVAEASAGALVSDSERTFSPGASSAEARIFHRAMDVIEELSADPEFSVRQLAQEVGVSDPRLREVFAAHGITARDAIRGSRTARALRLLDEGNYTSREDLERIAASAGFPSARTMSAALKRERE